MREEVQEWLERAIEESKAPVFSEHELPVADMRRQLRRSGALVKLPGGVYLLRHPADDPVEVIHALYWPIIAKLLEQYAPAVVERGSAVRLYLGDASIPEAIRIRQGRNSRTMSEELSPGLRLLMKPGAVDPQQVQELTVSQARVKVDNPARVLLGLPVGVIRENLDDIVIWLRSLLLSRSSVEAAYEANPRPVVLRRLAHLAEDAGNERLAGILTDVVEAAQDVRIGRGQTGVGRSLVISSRLLDRPALERPWLERLENQISVAEEVVTDVLDSSSLERMPPNQTVQFARSAKEADAYHSTSMEGYRLRPEDVSVLLGGSPRNALTEDEIRTRMAIAGYSKAFDGLLVRFESDGEVRITQNLILDLYADLWSPSVEAGLVESGQLREWRNQQVYIRNSRYVPPAPERVGEMMAHFVDRMMALADHYVRGVLAHLFLVTIHPFPDGNGRIGRFLMNAAFLDGGIPWLTIPVEERNGYFAALQQAQLDNDAATFARFIDELRGSGALSSGTPAPPASR